MLHVALHLSNRLQKNNNDRKPNVVELFILGPSKARMALSRMARQRMVRSAITPTTPESRIDWYKETSERKGLNWCEVHLNPDSICSLAHISDFCSFWQFRVQTVATAMNATEGWGPGRWEPRRVGGPKPRKSGCHEGWRAQNCDFSTSLSTIFILSSLSWRSCRGILEVFEALKCARLEFSGCRVKPRPPLQRRVLLIAFSHFHNHVSVNHSSWCLFCVWCFKCFLKSMLFVMPLLTA